MRESVPEPVAVRLAGCPICGCESLARRPVPYIWIGENVFGRHRGAFGVTACTRCAFEFVNPRPTDDLLGAFYGGADYGCHDPTATDTDDARAIHVLEHVARHVGGRRVLDFGCGAGVFLRCAVAAGWQATGYDLGASALANCRRQGLDVTGDLGALPRGTFDVIVLSHVFEHVTDLRATLGTVRELLAPDGALFIECPNVGSLRARLSLPVLSRHARFDERYRAFPIHLSYFTPRTLRDLLDRSGFTVHDVTTWGFGVEEILRDPSWPTPESGDSAPRAERESPPSPRRRAGFAKRLAKRVLSRLVLDTGLGENVVVIARAR